MKLIVESTFEQVEYLTEGKDNNNLYLHGIFAQAEVKNRNNRVYPRYILEREMNRYDNTFIKNNCAFGELGHPVVKENDKRSLVEVDPDRICHRIVEMRQQGNNWICKSQISSTPSGSIIRGLVLDGGKIGVSTRALGSLRQMDEGHYVVNEDLHLTCIDVVINPSAPEAYVNGIYEGREWVWNNGILQESIVSQLKEDLDRTSKTFKKNIGNSVINEEEAIKSFKKYIDLIARKSK